MKLSTLNKSHVTQKRSSLYCVWDRINHAFINNANATVFLE